MTWPTDKLGLIVQQCSLTGDNTPIAAEDGSDEWRVCSAAYEFGIEYMFDKYNWKQITKATTLVSTGVAPVDDQFDTAYAKPQDCIHVISVKLNGYPVTYQVLNNQIVLNSAGSTGAAPIIKYTSSDPNGDASTAQGNMLRMFMTALGLFVQAGIYRGLHEDLGEARAREREAMAMVEQAAARADQEQPKRALFNFRTTAARRVRRPWPSTPGEWGGR
jgi:hypothetical protein